MRLWKILCASFIFQRRIKGSATPDYGQTNSYLGMSRCGLFTGMYIKLRGWFKKWSGYARLLEWVQRCVFLTRSEVVVTGIRVTCGFKFLQNWSLISLNVISLIITKVRLGANARNVWKLWFLLLSDYSVKIFDVNSVWLQKRYFREVRTVLPLSNCMGCCLTLYILRSKTNSENKNEVYIHVKERRYS